MNKYSLQTTIFQKIIGAKYLIQVNKMIVIIDLLSKAKDLIARLLKVDPKERYTAKQTLKHPLDSGKPSSFLQCRFSSGIYSQDMHEFSTVPKVTEDVTDIILNLKELTLRSELEEPTTVYLKAKGPPRSRPVTSRRPRASRSSTPTCTSPRSARAPRSRWR